MKLFPTFAVPSIAQETESVMAEYSESIFFDMSKGDIVLDHAGRVKMADGREAWMQWCMKMLATERGTLLAYPTPTIGCEIEAISELSERTERENALISTIKDTLMNDPAHRTLDVTDFVCRHESDSIIVSFAVVGADGYTGNLTVEVEG